jgi:hypothetical protein
MVLSRWAGVKLGNFVDLDIIVDSTMLLPLVTKTLF